MIMIHFWFVISFLFPCFILKLFMMFYNHTSLAQVWWGPVPGRGGRLVRGGADLEVRTGNGFLLDNRTLHPGKCPSIPFFTIPYLSKTYNIIGHVHGRPYPRHIISFIKTIFNNPFQTRLYGQAPPKSGVQWLKEPSGHLLYVTTTLET